MELNLESLQGMTEVTFAGQTTQNSQYSRVKNGTVVNIGYATEIVCQHPSGPQRTLHLSAGS